LGRSLLARPRHLLLTGLKQADEPARLLTASRTLELANKAYSVR
jgi:hypothetical protein